MLKTNIPDCDRYYIKFPYCTAEYWMFTGNIRYTQIRDQYTNELKQTLIDFEIVFIEYQTDASLLECIRQGLQYGFKDFWRPKKLRYEWIAEKHLFEKNIKTETIVNCTTGIIKC